jgi:hypothetical protein
MTISYLVPTVGRPSLEAALHSIRSQAMPGDQVIVISEWESVAERVKPLGCEFVKCPPGRDWGSTERNTVQAMGVATGDYLAFLDDDDEAVVGSRVAMETALTQHPGQPCIFKMHYPVAGHTLWAHKDLSQGNVGTPMFVLPNDSSKLGTWGTEYGGDYQFIKSCQWDRFDYIWVDAVIARIRPNA